MKFITISYYTNNLSLFCLTALIENHSESEVVFKELVHLSCLNIETISISFVHCCIAASSDENLVSVERCNKTVCS